MTAVVALAVLIGLLYVAASTINEIAGRLDVLIEATKENTAILTQIAETNNIAARSQAKMLWFKEQEPASVVAQKAEDDSWFKAFGGVRPDEIVTGEDEPS